ncbi:gastrula zinc finger protein XlCGF62.1-like [Argiope bruennichi]|uniref:gastrula zinc finger protein XlCGF62.1-like n=1 Tax=Argiope bruennichi TaxID=94029 RepID=UPI002495810D|nr:gastrula zinc finger protein XlCGF62.1-like [Argiope bruennichi]
MNSKECVIKKAHSDSNNISRTENLIVNPDVSPGSKEPRNGKIHESQAASDEHISLEVHFQGQNKKKKMNVKAKEDISSKTHDNAVAGASGVCPRKKKFPKSCNRKDTIKTHHRTHAGDLPLLCNTCNKQFSKKSDLNRHYRIHTGEKPYVCDICGQKFNQKEHRDRHYRTHTRDKPYVCDICEEKFNQKRQLDSHYRTHTGDKFFVCDDCGKVFTLKYSLKRHMQSHTGEKPYKCPVCGKTFTTSIHCKSHQRRKHH